MLTLIYIWTMPWSLYPKFSFESLCFMQEAFIAIILSTTLHSLKMIQNIPLVKNTIYLEQIDK